MSVIYGNPNGVAIIQPRVGAGDTSPRAYPGYSFMRGATL